MANPVAPATTNSWPMVSPPKAAATGTLAISSVRATSHQMSSGRLRDRSTSTPAGSPISSHGSHWNAESSPTSNADA